MIGLSATGAMMRSAPAMSVFNRSIMNLLQDCQRTGHPSSGDDLRDNAGPKKSKPTVVKRRE